MKLEDQVPDKVYCDRLKELIHCGKHNASYRCPNCRKCFACAHKLIEALPPWWECIDGNRVRTNANGQFFYGPPQHFGFTGINRSAYD